MEFTITVAPGGQQFSCSENHPLLTAAIKANILMPYSCRAGQCGTCRGQVDAGSFEYAQGQPLAISESETAEGLALFCSAYPRSDMTIRVRARQRLEG